MEWGASLILSNKMTVHITINLFATLKKFTPESSDSYPVKPGITVKKLLEELFVPEDEVKLIFIDGVKQGFAAILNGGERVGIFPAVGGG